MLQSLKDFDDFEAASAPTIAVGVLIALVHLFYIGYFLLHLLPELFAKFRTMYHRCRSLLSIRGSLLLPDVIRRRFCSVRAAGLDIEPSNRRPMAKKVS